MAQTFRDNFIWRTIDLDRQCQQVSEQAQIYLYGYIIYNPNAVNCFVKFLDDAAQPEVSVDTKLLCPLQVAPGGQIVFMGAEALIKASNYLWVAATTGYEDIDNTNPATVLYASFWYHT